MYVQTIIQEMNTTTITSIIRVTGKTSSAITTHASHPKELSKKDNAESIAVMKAPNIVYRLHIQAH